MRIGIISSLFPPDTRGGAELIAARVAKGLRVAGHDVFVITTSADSRRHRAVMNHENGLRVYRFRPLNIFPFQDISNQPLWKRALFACIDAFQWHGYFVVKHILRTEHPELIITHNMKGIGYLTPRAIRSLGIRHIHTLHDVQLAVPSGLILTSKESVVRRWRWYAMLMRFIIQSPDVVISPSAWLLQFHEHLGFFKGADRRIIPNPIEPEQLTCEKSLAHEVVQYAYIGQLESHKGIDLLTSVFGEFASRGMNTHLVIVGTGTLYDKLRFKYADHPSITILGPIPHAELCARVLRHAHYVIAPSLCYENSPGVVYDSMASGTPVIVSDSGGAAELLKHSDTGYIIEQGSRIELMRALEISYAQAAHSRDMGERARMYIKDFVIDRYIERLLA